MNKYRILSAVSTVFILFLFAGSVPLPAAEITPATSIRNIVLYPDRAMVKRGASAWIQKGENLIKISGISTNLIDESVEAAANGGKILEVKIEKTFLIKIRQEKIKGLEDKIEEINGRIKNHANEAAVVQNSIEFFKKLNPFPDKQKVAPAEIEGHLKFMERSLTESYKELTAIEDKIRRLTDDKKMLEQELKSSRSLKEESKSILITLLSERETAVDLVCSYSVYGASWQPQYEVRADSRGGKVEFSSFAALRQSTGEDWKGVNIEISTARPAVRGIPPDISGWYVDEYRPRPPARKSVEAAARSEYPRQKMAVEREMGEGDGPSTPEVKAEATAFSFVLPMKVDIPADNQPHRVLLASSTGEVKLNYASVPKMSGYAYLRTDLKNPFSFPLLGGGVNIFIDGKFVSTASFSKTILKDENMNLSLGIDESVKVESKLLKRYTDQVGTFSKEVRDNFEYLMEVTNGKENEIMVEVKDRYPVSRNEKIKVDLKTPEKGAANIGEEGIISWLVKLSPGEKKQFKTIFSVTYPKDLRVTGLD